MSDGNGSPKPTFVLDQSVPLPKKTYKHLHPKEPVYPWKDMKVGQSFFVPLVKGKSFSAHTARMRAHPNNGKYEVRRVVENGTDGVRVWRVV